MKGTVKKKSFRLHACRHERVVYQRRRRAIVGPHSVEIVRELRDRVEYGKRDAVLERTIAAFD